MPRLRNNQEPAGDKVRFSVFVLAETVKRIEEMADKKGLSRNALISQLLTKATTAKVKKS